MGRMFGLLAALSLCLAGCIGAPDTETETSGASLGDGCFCASGGYVTETGECSTYELCPSARTQEYCDESGCWTHCALCDPYEDRDPPPPPPPQT